MQSLLVNIYGEKVDPKTFKEIISDNYLRNVEFTVTDMTNNNAEWKPYINPNDENDNVVCCSSCRRINDFPSAYCPFCGKRMNG